MEKQEYILVILLLAFCNMAMGQSDSSALLKAEFSAGVLRKGYAYPMTEAGLVLKLPYVKLKFSHSRALAVWGEQKYSHRIDDRRDIDERYLIYQKFRGLNYSELSIYSDFVIGRFLAFAGVGAFIQNTKDNFSYGVLDESTNMIYQKTRGENELGYSLFIGYRWKNWNFSYHWYKSEYRNLNAGWLKLGYQLDLIQGKQSKRPDYVVFSEQKKRRNSIKFGMIIRDKYSIPIGSKFSGTTTKLGVGFHLFTKGKRKIYLNADLININHGADKIATRYYDWNVFDQWGSGTIRTSAQSYKNVSVKTLALGYNFVEHLIGNQIGIEYGGGLSMSHFKNREFIWDRNSESTQLITKIFPGVFLQSLIRIGPFETGAEFHIPIAKSPPILTLFWAVGINYRKKGERINVYDKTPGWN